MKKIIILIILCITMIGCTKEPVSEVPEGPIHNQTIEYENGEIILRIIYTDDYPDGFEFQFELNGSGLGEFARYEDQTYQTAIGEENEDGHSYHFTFQKDKVVVKESEGQNSLGVHLSGEYIKK